RSVTTDEDTPVSITLVGADLDGIALAYFIVSGPIHGTLSGTTGAFLTYTPSPDFNGTDGFTYKVNDGITESNVATVSLTINSVNDAPTLDPLSNLTLEAGVGPQTITLTG